jgi:RHS repeat-associated protein
VASQEGAGGPWYHHHYDGTGNCIMLTTANGGLQEQYDYDAFGFPYFYSATGGKVTAPPHTRFLFTGREWLRELRIYDYRARQYQPELGRFLQPDPKEFGAGDYNLYRYCRNDPVNKTDPTGTYEQDVHQTLTEYLAINAGFSRQEAHNIALANQRTDTNSLTSPFAGSDARRAFHFTTQERRDTMRAEAFRTKSEELFGRYLHALQDSYSHQRGGTDRNGEPYGANFGHLGDGHAPDKTANRPELANRMARDSYNELRSFYQETHGREAPDNWHNMNEPIDLFVRTYR